MIFTPFLCIDTDLMRVRRYVRNPHRKVWMTHEATLEVHDPDTLFKEMEEFRLQPRTFPLNPAPAEAA